MLKPGPQAPKVWWCACGCPNGPWRRYCFDCKEPRARTLFCDVCGLRIVRRKDNFDERLGPAPYARHVACESVEVALVLVPRGTAAGSLGR